MTKKVRSTFVKMTLWLAVAVSFVNGGYAQASLKILLPERTRLLEDQRLDLVIEVRHGSSLNGFRVTANDSDITSAFAAPRSVDLDCDGVQDAVYQANLFSFATAGSVRLSARVNSGASVLSDTRDIEVRAFRITGQPRNMILFIGDAMGTVYRDAARIVSRSVETRPGVSGFREGFFDRLLEMDRMPVSGMVMTYASDRVIPDSANTATAWTTGNKTFEGALGVFADGADCRWRSGVNLATLPAVLDNPRIETFWEYLKRKYGYRTGIVSSAFITDATPAGQGAHTASRQATFEVARQYLENPILGNQPGFDVIFGGGKEDFDPDIRTDGRDLVAEFQARGYRFVRNRSELLTLPATDRALGLFRRPNNVSRASNGIRASANGNMETAYDKLHLTRPGSEPEPNFGIWTDQPFLDEMTRKAIEILSSGSRGPFRGERPFILMVEGALIDKQSHPNNAAGVIWDTIELDKSVGAARAWASPRKSPDTLVLVTADHDQSMQIIGVTDISDAALSDRTNINTMTMDPAVGPQIVKIFNDVNTNVRAAYNYNASGGDANTSGREGPPAAVYGSIPSTDGFPDYQDTDGDGYPENREAAGKGRKRLVVGFRTGNHTGSSVPITAEGPGAFLFTGYMDQSDIMFKAATALSGDTAEGDDFVNRVILSNRYSKTFGK